MNEDEKVKDKIKKNLEFRVKVCEIDQQNTTKSLNSIMTILDKYLKWFDNDRDCIRELLNNQKQIFTALQKIMDMVLVLFRTGLVEFLRDI
jgi:hypothetical protein